jgi:chromosome segregation ATPase
MGAAEREGPPVSSTFGGNTMLKKILIGSALVAGTGALIGGTSAYSYIKTGYHSVRDSIKEQIPIDLEIKRVRDMIQDLKPEIAENLRVIAREEVEVAKLQREVATKSVNLDKSKDAILKLKDDLQSGVKYVSYGGKSYDMDQVKKDLNERFKHFQTQEATVNKLEKMLDARERNLEAARRKLDTMLAAKRQHEVAVESLQARWTIQQVAEATSQYSIHDTKLNSVRDTLDEISTRLDVAEKMVDQGEVLTGIPVLEEDAPADLVDQITSYFGNDSIDVTAVVKSK